jgi:hypothetical protein
MGSTKKLCGFAALTFSAALYGAAPSLAQSVGIGSTKGGATAQVTSGIAKVVSAFSGMQMRPQPMGGTQQYIPVVNAGELEFGVSNSMQAYMAFTGTGMSAGKKYPNLRLVATLMTFRTGLFVAKKSGIKSIADLRGKRVPGVFSASPLFKYLVIANLANAGLGWKDVKMVPQTALRQHWQAFAQGKIDVAVGAIGSGIIKKLNAQVGGVMWLDLSTEPAAAKRSLDWAPKTTIETVNPAKPLVGVVKPTHVLHFEYLLWTHKGVSNEVVGRVTKALYEHQKDLHQFSPLWRSHRSARMGKDFGAEMPYHPGAIGFYKKAGIWKGK